MKVNDSEKDEENKLNIEEDQKSPIQESRLRYLILVLACLLMFGNNYSFDNPQALQRQLTTDMNISISSYNLLYTAFAFPNIFLTLIGGLIIDFLGVRFAIITFSAIIVAAQAIIATGGLFKNYWIMLGGRIIFGCASENLLISQTAIIGKWFRGKELSTAIGYIMTMPEVASAANSFITPMMYDKFNGLAYPLYFSVFLCFLSFLCGIVLCILDRKNEIKQKGITTSKLELQYVYKDNTSEKSEQIEKVSFQDIKNLNGTFWILILICTLAIGSYVPFLDDANDFLQEKFEFSYIQSGRFLTLTYMAAGILTSFIRFLAISSPFLGPYVDRIGKRRLLIIITCIIFSITHFLLGFMKAGHEGEPNYFSLIPLVMLGSCYSMYCCILIPSIQYVVSQKVVGTAFGLMGMFTSASMAVFPIIAAYIVENSHEKQEGYSSVGYFFCGVCLLALIFTSSLYFFDKQSSMILDFVNPECPTDEELNLLKSVKQEQNESLGIFEDIDDDLLKIEGEEEEEDEDQKNHIDPHQWEKNSRFLVSSKGFSTPKLLAHQIPVQRANSFVS